MLYYILEEMDEEEICYDIKSKDKDSLVSKELAASETMK